MTGLQSPVGLGTAPLGSRVDGPLWWGPQDPADAVGAVRAALDAGVDWIDTAPFSPTVGGALPVATIPSNHGLMSAV